MKVCGDNMENEISNNKFLFLAIFLITLSSFCAFLIGYGINSGECPPCKDKTIVKVFTTTNNVVSEVDYNMLNSDIKKNQVGKYINKIDTIVKTDSIPKIVSVEKKVEVNHIYWWQKLLMWLGGITIVLLIIVITYRVKK